MKEFSFLLVAGGSGHRIGGPKKQFRELGGKPLWRWSADLAAGLSCEGVREIVLVLPADFQCHDGELPATIGETPLIIAAGGAERADSVRSGLAKCSCDYVMVHDAARPFAGRELLLALMDSTSESVGAIPVTPIAEAVKKIAGQGADVAAVDRDGLYATQTPQSFFKNTLIDVLDRYGHAVKDEAEAWLQAGLKLNCIEGERLNFKVTWPEDLRLAESLVSRREVRTGIGYDVHELVPERPLIIGGVTINCPLGLLGHSDADILAHTVADAILGAAGLPDIGNLFPASDETYRNADSIELLRRAAAMVQAGGWTVRWVDAVIEAQVPRLNCYLPAMKAKIFAALGQSGEPCVNIKAKSAERLGDAGEARSMRCRAVATLER